MALLTNTFPVNIQSHWVGGVMFGGLWLYHLPRIYVKYQGSLDAVDKVFMTFFMTGALICLFLSGSYHMASSHSKPVRD